MRVIEGVRIKGLNGDFWTVNEVQSNQLLKPGKPGIECNWM